MIQMTKDSGSEAVYAPQADASGSTGVPRIDVYPVETLARLARHLRDYYPIELFRTVFDLDADPPAYAADFQDIKGQMST